jgi:subtilisin-like proprotein convertase family protein
LAFNKMKFIFVFALLIRVGSSLLYNSPTSCICTNASTTLPCASTLGLSNCTSEININQTGIVQTIVASFYVSHGKTDQIIISLIAPDQTKFILYNKEIDQVNINRTYSYQILNTFQGKSITGVWKLNVNDNHGGGHGTLGIQWSLNIDSNETTTSTTTTSTSIPLTQITTSTSYTTTQQTSPSNSSPVNINSLPASQVVDMLTSNQDVTPCLLNCSNHGQCVIKNTNQLVCECDQHYTGAACNVDKRKCSSNPCLYNATCTDIIDSQGLYSFNCLCAENYYGTYCEKRVDVCANETCSNNGVCKNKEFVATCECFKMYSGEKCQTESSQMKAIKTTTKFTSILAILILVGFYLLFILIDIWNLYESRKKMKLNKQKEKVHKKQIFKFIYKN